MKCGHEQTIEVLRAEITRLEAERAELGAALRALVGRVHVYAEWASRDVTASQGNATARGILEDVRRFKSLDPAQAALKYVEGVRS
jgi:hypothetical protein